MLSDYFPILVMVVAASAIGIGGAVISWVAGPKKPSANKLMPYESGMVPIGSARIRFPVKFYLVAMLFIIFDVEIVFFYPLAVVYRQLRFPGHEMFPFAELVIFIAIFAVGYIYVWKKGALDWR